MTSNNKKKLLVWLVIVGLFALFSNQKDIAKSGDKFQTQVTEEAQKIFEEIEEETELFTVTNEYANMMDMV